MKTPQSQLARMLLITPPGNDLGTITRATFPNGRTISEQSVPCVRNKHTFHPTSLCTFCSPLLLPQTVPQVGDTWGAPGSKQRLLGNLAHLRSSLLKNPVLEQASEPLSPPLITSGFLFGTFSKANPDGGLSFMLLGEHRPVGHPPSTWHQIDSESHW